MKNKPGEEVLYTCPLCERTGFTLQGIKNHRCRALRPSLTGQYQRLDPVSLQKALLNPKRQRLLPL